MGLWADIKEEALVFQVLIHGWELRTDSSAETFYHKFVSAVAGAIAGWKSVTVKDTEN